MSETDLLSLQLASDLSAQVRALAVEMDRSETWLVEQAVREFIEHQAWQLAAIDAGIEDLEEGRVVPHEAVTDWVNSLGTDRELPLPE